jgi:hypothetical protein
MKPQEAAGGKKGFAVKPASFLPLHLLSLVVSKVHIARISIIPPSAKGMMSLPDAENHY